MAHHSSSKKPRLPMKTVSSDDEDFGSKSLASLKTDMEEDDDGRLFPEEMVTVKVEESHDGPSYATVQALMEDLIEAVRVFPCLWNTHHEKYRDQMKKDMAWRAVVVHLNSSQIPDIKTAKAEWKKLRDNHRDSLKRVKAGYGQERINPWKFAEDMSFLLPCMKTRKKSNKSYRSLSLDCETRLESDPSMSEALQRLEQLRHARTAKQDQSYLEDHDSESRSSDDNARKKKNDSYENDRYKGTNRHPLDLFFESMCQTTKEFPAGLQRKVKRQIFSVITEAEDYLDNSSTIAHTHFNGLAAEAINSNGESI